MEKANGLTRPFGYWTYGRCKREALRYQYRGIFRSKNPFVYGKILRKGWNLCSHMKWGRKKNGYWTFEKCKKIASKYASRSAFALKDIAAYKAAFRNKWLLKICGHMKYLIHPNGFWDFERCRKMALKCSSRKEYKERFLGAFTSAYSNGWLDEICLHMKPLGHLYSRCIYAYEFSDKSVYIGLTCNINERQKQRDAYKKDAVTKHILETKLTPNRKMLTDFVSVDKAAKLEGHFVRLYKENGWNILNRNKTGGLGRTNIKWTLDAVKKESLRYPTRNAFRKAFGGAYGAACKHGWLNKIFSHISSEKKYDGMWTKERCLSLADKYKKNKEKFRKEYPTAHSYMYKMRWWGDLEQNSKV